MREREREREREIEREPKAINHTEFFFAKKNV
jgi:hypothetical protein